MGDRGFTAVFAPDRGSRFSVGEGGKGGPSHRKGPKRANMEEGEGGFTCAKPSGFVARVWRPCGVAERCRVLTCFALPFRCQFLVFCWFFFLNASNPSVRKQRSWAIYWVIFLGACSSFNLPAHQSSHISPDRWRIVKLKVNRTAFAMETKVARGWIATTQWCALKLRSYIPRVPWHLGFRH